MIIDSLKRTKHSLAQLDKFVLDTKTANTNEVFRESLTLSLSFINEYLQYPELTYHCIRHHFDSKSAHLQHLRTMSILLVVAKANHYSDTPLSHILAALISAQRYSIQASNSENQKIPSVNDIKTAQKKNAKMEIGESTPSWLFLATLGYSIHRKGFLTRYSTATNLDFMDCLRISSQIAHQFSKHDKHISLELKTVFHITQQAPSLSHLLAPLVTCFSPFWSRVLVSSGSALVIVIDSDHKEFRIAKVSKSDKSNTTSIKFRSIEFSKLCLAVTDNKLAGFSLWLKAHTSYFSKTRKQKSDDRYSIQRPPENLLSIIHKLHNPKSEPEDIAKLVQQSPFYSRALQQSAQQVNRQSIPVTNVKQAVLTHGMGRVGMLLTEQVLWSRLSHAKFPLSNALSKLMCIHRFICADVAFILKLPLPQEFSLLATFQLSYLFTSQFIRLRTEWFDSSINREIPDSLFEDVEQGYALKSAYALAAAWHQPPEIIKPLKNFNSHKGSSSVSQSILILKISLFLSRTWLNGLELTESEQDNLCKQFAVLNINKKNLISLREDVSHLLICDVSNS
jgi:hypothetical protein